MPSSTLTKPQFFSFQESLWFLDRGYDDCMHAIKGQKVLKAIATAGGIVAFQVEEQGDSLLLEVSKDDPHLVGEVKNYVRTWWDLDRDLSPFYSLLHPLGNMLQRKYFGLRLVGIPDLFEALCWSIIGQQINLTFAYRLKRRFVETYGTTTHFNGVQLHLFPKPEVVSQLTIAELKDLQFSKQKADYIIAAARHLEEVNLHDHLQGMEDDTMKMSEELQQLRGVGEWTANYVLMKTYGRTDSVPYGDAGLINGVKNLLALPSKPSGAELKEVLAGSEGWEAYLVYYIWRSLSEPPPSVS